MKNNDQGRIEREVEHGEKICFNPEAFWGYDTPVAKLRVERRIAFFLNYGSFGQGSNVLEIGCGAGIFTKRIMERTQSNITAIDISPVLLQIAAKKISEVSFKVEDAMNLSFEDDSFDCVYGNSTIHHLEIFEALNEFYRVLKKGGKLIFSEPNMINPQICLQKRISYIKKRIGDSPDETAINRWNLNHKLQKCGFRKTKLFPYEFLHPYTPKSLIKPLRRIEKLLEKVPLIREIAGSVIIFGVK
jgi:ubiquinone/menaquinone biosynthesis C-methylase UbiE